MASTGLLTFVTSVLRKTNKTEQKRRQREIKYQISEQSRKKDHFIRYRNCRREKLLLLMLTMMTLINPPRERNLWMNPQSDDWFRMGDSTFTPEQWYENFRVTNTFTFVLGEIEHKIARHSDAQSCFSKEEVSNDTLLPRFYNQISNESFPLPKGPLTLLLLRQSTCISPPF